MAVSNRRLFSALVAAAASFLCACAQDALKPPQTREWLADSAPAEGGFDADALAAARRQAETLRSGAVLVVHEGHVVAAWGDLTRPFPMHSVRKSLLGALLGIAIDEGLIALDATLGDLGIDELGGLTAAEREATTQDLLLSRSGVYLPAAYATDEQRERRPARGAHPPGTNWYYNNWEFNALGTIYESMTGKTVYAAFDRRIARPLGMQDYDPATQFLRREPSVSNHAAHSFSLSARDLARFGQLFLDDGRYDGRQVIPSRWIDLSTRKHVDFGNGTGYGYLWWVYEAGALAARYPSLGQARSFHASGAGGQALFVIPSLKLVIVHCGDSENRRPVTAPELFALVDRIVAARVAAPIADPRLMELRAMPFSGQARAPPPFVAEPAAPERLSGAIGDYSIAPGASARVFVDGGAVFLNLPGRGDAQVFVDRDGTFTVRVLRGVRIRFLPSETAPEALEISLPDRSIRGVKTGA